MGDPKETERKILVPPLPDAVGPALRQGGITAPDALPAVRLRRSGQDQTVKSGDGVVRIGQATGKSADPFETPWRATEGPCLERTRRTGLRKGDVHQGVLAVGAGFGSQGEAAASGPPSWLGPKVGSGRRFASLPSALWGAAPVGKLFS